MLQIRIKGSQVAGKIPAPASKSYTQRLLAASLLARGTSVIHHPSKSADGLAALEVIRQLGATIKQVDNQWSIKGGLNPMQQKLDCGEAGLSIRMFPAIAAMTAKPMILTGSGSLLSRPVQMVVDALSQLGVQCQSQNGLPPLWIRGPLKGGTVRIDGTLSSQLLTGLLLALPAVKPDSVIEVTNLQSTPYIDMTLEILRLFGVEIENQNYARFIIKGGQSYRAIESVVEGDWSGAAFMLVAGAIAGKVTVSRLNPSSLQADRRILEALEAAGAQVSVAVDEVTVERKELKPFVFDATHCPDLFPPLVALAAHCKGSSQILGVGRLKHKESNRAQVLKDELGKMGVPIRFDTHQMYINGAVKLRPAEVDPHGDHRMAMAAAITALPGNVDLTITGAECISKSYPEFYDDLKQIGGLIL